MPIICAICTPLPGIYPYPVLYESYKEYDGKCKTICRINTYPISVQNNDKI
jgi:hypothetical protein